MSDKTDKLLERLKGTCAFRPMTVATFADWSLDAGDVVTVREPEMERSTQGALRMPIFDQSLSWGGAATGTISCTGEEKRPVEKQGDRDEQRFRKTTNKKISSLDSSVSSLNSGVSSLKSSVSNLQSALGSEISLRVITKISRDGTLLKLTERYIGFYGSIGSETTSYVNIG